MNKLQNELLKFAELRDWDQFHTPKDLAISVSIEAAELLDIFQWRDQSDPVTDEEKASIASEVADIGQYLLLLCAKADIDFEHAIRAKLAKNKVRFPIKTAKGIAKPVDQTRPLK
ncbi:nucleotide pyrophosphohydrolase [Pseudopelagicola sp. nBUS_19]|uniref:nucleotide pyrophosphohydrolase n=1 Tax=Pseudopelagicola sp. nBUS_19 TaxID=3395316 RepID=UPI003EBC453C